MKETMRRLSTGSSGGNNRRRRRPAAGHGRRGVERLTRVDLAKDECANYTHGLCMGGRSCEVLAGHGCAYFEAAVLPLHSAQLGAEGPQEALWDGTRRCAGCGVEFTPGSHRALWCPACRAAVHRAQTRARVARYRQRVIADGSPM